MEVYERVNAIIKNKKLTKRAFSNIIRNLEVKLKITGEVPSENTIYAYLSGKITIPIELIPYIAEALDITEQELFDSKKSAKKKCIKYLMQNADNKELEKITSYINSQMTQKVHINYGQVIMKNIELKNNKIDELIQLLEYAPTNFLDRAIEKLREYKNISSDF